MKLLGALREFTTLLFNKTDNSDLEIRPATTSTDGEAEVSIAIPDTANDTFVLRTSSDTLANRLQNKDLDSDTVLFADQADNVNKRLTFNLVNLSAPLVLSMPDYTTGTAVLAEQAQTLDDKTLADMKFTNSAKTFEYTLLTPSWTNSVNLTLPALTTDDTLAMVALAQTFDNKTIVHTNGASGNTISGLTNATIDASAAIETSKLEALTANRATELDASGFIVASAVTNTELNHLSGVTSAIQTQIDSKSSTALDNLTIASLAAQDLLVASSGSAVSRLGVGLNGQVLTVSGGAVTWDNPAGTGDVVGPGSSTDNAIARYNLATGKVIQDSGVILDDNDYLSGLEYLTHNQTPPADLTVSSNTVGFHPLLTIDTGRTLTIDSGAQFNTMDTLTNNGTIVNNGTLHIG